MSSGEYYSAEELLRPENMIRMYAQGAFPMADEDKVVNWYLPDIRTIIPLDNYNVPRSLKKFMRENDYEYKYDNDPIEIIKNCMDRKETWISKKLLAAYKRLHKLGFIHSVEVFSKNKLIGGLYGVTFRGAFFGESMFSKRSQASKCALVKLLERLNEKKFILLDVQFETEHLKMFNTREITFENYTKLLKQAYRRDVNFF